LLIINEGRIAADGPVDELVAQASGAIRIAVEVSGSGVSDAVRDVEGVRQVEEVADHQTGRLLLNVTADSSPDVRPAIFDLAKTKDWTLYELHQETRSLEDLFRELTSGTGSTQ
jgi:ABC-2 type transport system ATP-binding protein